MSIIKIVPLGNTKKEIKEFVKFPWKIYKGNNYWVPPIIFDQIKFILNGPYREIGVIQPFLAYKDGEIAGRIIAHYDNRYNEYYKEKRGAVGFFECINDKEVSRALFNAAENWLAEQGMLSIHGPMSFILYDNCGLLIDDFDAIPPIELGYNLPYYSDLFMDYGFEKSVDWYAYLFKKDQNIPSLFYKVRNKIKSKPGLVFRSLSMKNYSDELNRIKKVINGAWAENWGHYPLTDKQIDFFADELKPIIKPELVILAEYEGTIAGFILSIPDANQAIKKANGRLFPFGVIKMLFELRKVKRIKTFLLGVLPEYRLKGFDVVLYLDLKDKAVDMGYNEADCSLIVETNINMINALEHLGAKRYKTYRMFSKSISG